MFPLVHDRGVKDLGEQSRMIGELFLKSGDDIATDRDVNMGERLLDHLAEGQTSHELHLGANRHAHDVRGLFVDGRKNQLPTHVPIDVDLIVLETCQNFTRHPGAIPQVALHRVEHQRGRIVGG